MDLSDFEKLRDPDASSKNLWAEVPEPVRKDVEQHVLAHLPADILTTLRDLRARVKWRDYRPNKPVFGSAFCPFLGRKGEWLSCQLICHEQQQRYAQPSSLFCI